MCLFQLLITCKILNNRKRISYLGEKEVVRMERRKKIFFIEGVTVLILGLFLGVIGMFTTLIFAFASLKERK